MYLKLPHKIKLFCSKWQKSISQTITLTARPKAFRLEMPEYHASASKNASFYCNLLCLLYRVIYAELVLPILLITLLQNLAKYSTEKRQYCFTVHSTSKFDKNYKSFPSCSKMETFLTAQNIC